MVEVAVEPRESSLVERLDLLFDSWNRSDSPGLVVGVALRDQTLYRRGFGMASLETGVANTPATRMRIGSTSKHFVSLLALLLAEDGKLDIDEPIRTYVEELGGPAGDPTLRQLMWHVGGSRCYLDLGFIGHGLAIPPLGTALRAMSEQTRRNFEPGAAMIYNNGGYHLLSTAIERVGGAPFEEQLKLRLFDPLGMSDTSFVPSDLIITPGVATLHVPNPEGGWRRGLFPSEEVRGEGGGVSTVDDMIRWMAHLRLRDRLGTGDTWTAMTTPPTFPDGTTGQYALGLMVDSYRGLRTLHHGGGVFGGTCQMLTLPDDGLDVVIIANGAPGADVARLAEQIVDIVLADRVGPQAATAEAEIHGDLKGVWYSPQTGVLYNVIEQAGCLKLAFGMGQVGLPLSPHAEGFLAGPAGGLGEIALSHPDADGFMTIRFGGQTAAYHSLLGSEEATSAFASVAVGRYLSSETGTMASISCEHGRLVLGLSDGHGRSDLELTVLGRDVAAASSGGLLATFGLGLTLKREGSDVVGMELTTMRTRNLAFTRLRPYEAAVASISRGFHLLGDDRPRQSTASQ